jgi:peroxiredoxin Q/BCP
MNKRNHQLLQRKNMIRNILTLTLALFLTATSSAQEGDTLKVGDAAPDWKLTGSDGKVYALSDFKDKQAVVVAWYPMALTGG